MIVSVNVVKSCYRKRQINSFGQAWHEEASWESQIENVVQWNPALRPPRL